MRNFPKDAWIGKAEQELLETDKPLSWQFTKRYGGMSCDVWPVPRDEPWYKERAPWNDRPIEPWKRPVMPTQGELYEGCSFETWGFAREFYIVTPAVKDVIESVEPNVHGFLDVIVSNNPADPDRQETYCILLFGTFLDFDHFVSHDSDCNVEQLKFPERILTMRSKNKGTPLKLRRPVIDKFHLWRTVGHQRHMSATLYDKLSSLKLVDGLEFSVNEIIDQ